MSLLEILIVILLVAWLFEGVIFPVGTSLVHLILVVILILIVVRLLQGRSL